jgi:hypothetical protein
MDRLILGRKHGGKVGPRLIRKGERIRTTKHLNTPITFKRGYTCKGRKKR